MTFQSSLENKPPNRVIKKIHSEKIASISEIGKKDIRQHAKKRTTHQFGTMKNQIKTKTTEAIKHSNIYK